MMIYMRNNKLNIITGLRDDTDCLKWCVR